jgi:hypothetical protein
VSNPTRHRATLLVPGEQLVAWWCALTIERTRQATLYKVASWTDAWGMFVMGKLVFQHVYMGAIEHGHNVKPEVDTRVFDMMEEYGSGSGGYLPYYPFPKPGPSKACYGAACFRPTALVGCALSVAAVASATLLVCRTSSYYRKLYAPVAKERSSRPHRQNYTQELAAQREEDYRRQQARRGSRELQRR